MEPRLIRLWWAVRHVATAIVLAVQGLFWFGVERATARMYRWVSAIYKKVESWGRQP